MNLDPLGMKGCFLYHSFDSFWLVPVINGTSVFAVFVPTDPRLVGARVYFQSAVGSVASNGGAVLIGNQ